MIDAIRADPLVVPFRQAFGHASAVRSSTQTIWVTATAGEFTGTGEGCPREYVTGESTATAQAFVARHASLWRAAIRSFEDLAAWVTANEREIDANPAAWCAVELALLDLFARARGIPVETLLGLPNLAGRFRYTAVIGNAKPTEFEAQVRRYQGAGFRAYKIKLAGDLDRDKPKVAALKAAGIAAESVRADANNAWNDVSAALVALDSLEYPFFALEEPLAALDYDGMARIANERGCKIVLDESMARSAQLDALPGPADHWLLNLRVSKMGGLLRSLAFLGAVRRYGMRVIVGAHVGETSLLTRAGMTAALAARDCLVAQEGAFGTHLLERDVVATPLMFGAGGLLDADTLPFREAPGWGLPIHNAA